MFGKIKKNLLLMLAVCLFSCKQTGTIRKISRNGSGFMCIGSKQFVSQKGKAEDAAVLNITAGNVIDLVDFTDENGEKIEVEVTGFVYVNEHYFVVRLNVGDFIVSYDSGICYKIDENVPSLGHRASQMDKYGNLYYIPGSESIVKLEFKQDGTLVQTVMADVTANEYPHINEYAVDCDGNLAYYNEDEKKIIFIAANGEKVGEHPCEPNGCKLYCDVQGKIVFVCVDEDKTYSVVSFVPFEKTERCDGNYWQSFSSKNRGKIIVGEGSKQYLISSDGSKEELGAEFAIPSPLAETVRLARHDSVLYYDGTWLDSNNNWHLGLIKFDMDDLLYKCIKEGYEDDSDWGSEIGGFHVYDVRCDNDGVLYFQGERISDGAYVTGTVSEDGNMNVLFENDTGVRELYYPAQI